MCHVHTIMTPTVAHVTYRGTITATVAHVTYIGIISPPQDFTKSEED